MLADEHDERHFRNTANPGITNELRIQGEQSIGALWVATTCGFPIDQAAGAVDITDGIQIAISQVT